MIILRFVFLCILFTLLASASEVENEGINLLKIIEEYSQRQKDAATSIGYNDSINDQSTKVKLKDGSRRKRKAILPTIFKGSLDTGLLPVGINAQVGPGINFQLNPGIPGALNTVTNPIQMLVTNPNNMNKILSDTQKAKTPYGIYPIANNRNDDNYIDTSQLSNHSENPKKNNSNASQSSDVINNTALRKDNEKYMNVSIEQNDTPGTLNTVTEPVQLLVVNPNIINQILNDTKIPKLPFNTINSVSNNRNGDNSIENSELNLDATTSTFNTSVVNAINKPLGGINNTAPQTNNEKSLNVLKKQNDIPGAFSIVSYPVQLFVINPKDMNTKLSDTQVENIKFSILNTIYKNRNGENSNVTSELNISDINNDVNSPNIAHDVVSITVSQMDNEKSLNNAKEKDHATLLNNKTSNKTNILLANQTDEYFLKNYEHNKQINEMDVQPMICNSTNNNINNLHHESQPSLLTDQKKIVLGTNGNNFKLLYDINRANVISDNKPDNRYFYPARYNLSSEFDQNKDFFKENYRNIKPEFRYPIDILNIKRNQCNQPENLAAYLFMEYIKNQYDKNMGHEYALEYNTNTRPEILADNHKVDNNCNDINEVYKKIDDSLMTSRKMLYYMNNNPSYGTVTLICGNSARPKRILRYCNQQWPVISCNGFYMNQNEYGTYPPYFYYPNAYRNLHLR